MALTRQVSQTPDTADVGTDTANPQAANGLSWLQGAMGNSALQGAITGGMAGLTAGPAMGMVGALIGGGVGAAMGALQGAQAEKTSEVPAIGSNTDVTSTTVRTALASNPRAIAALDELTSNAGFTTLPADQQGALLAQFQAAPNAATGQYLRGLAGYHTAEDKEAGLAAYNNALNPDSGAFSVGGVSYTIQNGQLMDANGQAAGDIHTDGTYQLTGQEGRTSIYDDIHSRINMVEGTGTTAKNLLNLHDADPNGKLTGANMNDTFGGLATDTLRDVRRENIDMKAVSGFRSFQEQDGLYAQGRTAPGNRVTNARGGQSWHNYGVAADLTFMNEAGTPHWREDGEYANLWQRYGQIAQGNGLEWGGDWRNADKPHIEYHPGYNASQAGNLSTDLRTRGLEAAWDRMGIGEQP